MTIETTIEPLPTPPPGFATVVLNGSGPSPSLGAQAAQVPAGTSWNLSHLLALNADGRSSGPTVCGLTRFDRRDPTTHELIERAGLPGWGLGGGLSGPRVLQVRCDTCWADAR